MDSFTKPISGIFILLLTLGLAACNGGDDNEKSQVEAFTEKTAQEALHAINEPLDRAEAVQGVVNQNAEQLEKAAE